MGGNELTYAAAIEELETIVNEIEAGEVDVDVLAAKVKRAAELIKFCNERLKGTQAEVNKILVDIEEKEGSEESGSEE
jgi:exodeoxyribonuclease VII small subunit